MATTRAADKSVQKIESYKYRYKGHDPLKQREELEKLKNQTFQEIRIIADEVYNHIAENEQKIFALRNPMRTGKSIQEQTLGELRHQSALQTTGAKQPKGFLINEINRAIQLKDRDYLSTSYDRYSELANSKDISKHDLDFYANQMERIQKFFIKEVPELPKLYEENTDLKLQAASIEQDMQMVDSGKDPNILSGWKEGYSGGQFK